MTAIINEFLKEENGVTKDESIVIDGYEVHLLYREHGRLPFIPGTMKMNPTNIVVETIIDAGVCDRYGLDLILAAENFYHLYREVEENGAHIPDELQKLCQLAIDVLDWNETCQDDDYGYPTIWWEGLLEPLSSYTELYTYDFEVEGEDELSKLGASLQMSATMMYSTLREYMVYMTATVAVANAKGQVEKVFIPATSTNPIYLLVREN